MWQDKMVTTKLQGKGRKKNLEGQGTGQQEKSIEGKGGCFKKKNMVSSAGLEVKLVTTRAPVTLGEQFQCLLGAIGCSVCFIFWVSRSTLRTKPSQSPLQSKPTMKSWQNSGASPAQPCHSVLSTQMTPAKRTSRDKYLSKWANWDNPIMFSQ